MEEAPTQGPGTLVIFDCDGVLVDSERLAVKVDQRVLADLGWNLSIEEIAARFMGCSHDHFRAEIERHIGRSLAPDWSAEYQPWYEETFERELTAVPGVIEALNEITLPTCVASNSGHSKLAYTLGATGLLQRFTGRIFSAEDVLTGKPAPDLFLHAALTLGFSPGECIVVEDSRFGVEAARAAGMTVLGYAGGLTPHEWLVGPGTTVFHDMANLPELIATGLGAG
ncbi:HAD family hydrolase [Arthrobacter sedimenti]|uniref:HAD family hydrolase n=1 Tax=Arthrobacter sedimenti TaxID=2694931 RepID=UPI000B353E8C|nr:HAD family hydrolase [Arthrobacter sedimenti]OUM43485.1 haloacid dehalogenase [Arthrobacter agilis]